MQMAQRLCDRRASMKVLYLLLFTMLSHAEAHPVIYKNGTMIGSQSMSMFSDNQINYSFHQKWATGLNIWRFSKDEKNSDFSLLRLNHLLKRWNEEDSQANIYLVSGAGVTDANIEKSGTKFGYLLGVEADWETRQLFTSAKYYHFSSPQLTDIGVYQARIGYSPYLADFDKLQSWVMLQGMYLSGVNDQVVVVPLMRFFYHNVLWEAGTSFRSEWFLNFMVHL